MPTEKPKKPEVKPEKKPTYAELEKKLKESDQQLTFLSKYLVTQQKKIISLKLDASIPLNDTDKDFLKRHIL